MTTVGGSGTDKLTRDGSRERTFPPNVLIAPTNVSANIYVETTQSTDGSAAATTDVVAWIKVLSLELVDSTVRSFRFDASIARCVVIVFDFF